MKNDMDKNDLDISSLIKRVREGDQQAFLSLLERYRPLLLSQVSRFTNDGTAKLHEEDLLQEATLVFYNSILNYDCSQNDVEFGLYARICIYNALVSQVRIINKYKAEQLTEFGGIIPSKNEVEDPADGIVEAESLCELYSTIKKNLSDFEYKIWHGYMLGRTAKQIGEAIGKDEKSVSNAIYRIRRKLRAVLK